MFIGLVRYASVNLNASPSLKRSALNIISEFLSDDSLSSK